MILKCAQHIRLPEHSHPPKLIKSYIAISCLIKATLCSENPAQLSNGCYSMKADCICLRDIQRGKENPHTLCHILNTHTHTRYVPDGQQGPETAKMGRGGSVWRGVSTPAGSDMVQPQTLCQLRLPSPEVS